MESRAGMKEGYVKVRGYRVNGKSRLFQGAAVLMPVLMVLCIGGLYKGVWDAGLEINLGGVRRPTPTALGETTPLLPLKSAPALEPEFTKLWLEALEQGPSPPEEVKGWDGGSLEEPQQPVEKGSEIEELFAPLMEVKLQVDTEMEGSRRSEVPVSVDQTPRTVASLPDVQPAAGPALKDKAVPSAAGWQFSSTALETTLPLFIEMATDRLDRALEVVGEQRLSRVFTEKEFQQALIKPLRQRFSHQIQGLNVEIHSNGLVGSGTIQIGKLKLPLVSRVGIRLENESPRVEIRELHVAGIPMGRLLLRALEDRINQSLDRKRLALAFKECEFREGAVWISVERK